jgi:mono/diheme cytochrome c family protein
MSRMLVSCFVALALPVSLSLPRAAAAEPEPKATYEKYCQKCHGPDGKGDTTAGRAVKVVSLVDPKFAVDEAAFMKLIKDNKKHATPLKKASEEEVAAAAKHARTLVGP